jgi:clan AA aspartic protease (TIGR02281 family)
MEKTDFGIYEIPCKINGLALKFIFDTGASTVSLSLTEALFMQKNGYLKDGDIYDRALSKIANGDIVAGWSIVIREINIDGLILKDVRAYVSDSLVAPLLLGQSALEQLGKIEINNKAHTLTISQ